MLRARRMHALTLDKDGRVSQSIAKDLIDILNGSVNRLKMTALFPASLVACRPLLHTSLSPPQLCEIKVRYCVHTHTCS